MSVRDDFLAFCETVCERPLTVQQRALVEALIANPQDLVVLQTARQGSRKFIRELHERFMQGRRSDLLIIDDMVSSAEAATLPVENNINSHNQRHAQQRGLGDIVESTEICRSSPKFLQTFKNETW